MNNTEEKRVWGIHSTDDHLFLRDNIIAIGWREMGDLRQIGNSRDDFKEKYIITYPDAKKGSIATSSGMLFRFLYEAQIGDYVVFPSKRDRMINIGVIESDYYFNDNEYEFVNQRKVKWLKKIPRTSFSHGALYEIGASLTFFAVRNYAEEYIIALEKPSTIIPSENVEKEGIIAAADEIRNSTTDYILKVLSRELKGYTLEEFVADLLRAMGYMTTNISKKGGDSGIDIIAYKDELPPRIVVQVKSQDSNIGESAIQSLRGAMREGDYGLFVTLSDYSEKAKRYLEITPIIKGINGIELVELILKYYNNLSKKYRDLLPMKKVYIPVINTESNDISEK